MSLAVSGHIYVIEFSSGIVKPGRTRSWRTRRRDHEASGLVHGVEISREWVSPLHCEYRVNESMLLSFVADRGTRAHGAEYFVGVDFDEIVEFAESLPKTDAPEARNARPTPRVDAPLRSPRTPMPERIYSEEFIQWSVENATDEELLAEVRRRVESLPE